MGKAASQKLLNDELARTRQKQADIKLSQTIAELNTRIRDVRICGNGNGDEDRAIAGLTKTAGLQLDRVNQVARKLENIKGDLIKFFKDSSEEVREIVETLAGRSTNEEVCTLRAANQRLQEKVEDLQKQLEGLQGRMDSLLADEGRSSAQWEEAGRIPARNTRSSRRSAPTVRQETEVEAENIPPTASILQEPSPG